MRMDRLRKESYYDLAGLHLCAEHYLHAYGSEHQTIVELEEGIYFAHEEPKHLDEVMDLLHEVFYGNWDARTD